MLNISQAFIAGDTRTGASKNASKAALINEFLMVIRWLSNLTISIRGEPGWLNIFEVQLDVMRQHCDQNTHIITRRR
jgi:hypothetical protein